RSAASSRWRTWSRRPSATAFRPWTPSSIRRGASRCCSCVGAERTRWRRGAARFGASSRRRASLPSSSSRRSTRRGASAAAEAALAAARAETLAALATAPRDESDPLCRDGYVFSMIAQHEAQHAETILQAIQLMPDLVYEPPRREEPRRATSRLEPAEAAIPAGPFVMGTDDRTRAYDNERPAHVVELPTYRIDAAPVTNGEFLRFMGDG